MRPRPAGSVWGAESCESSVWGEAAARELGFRVVRLDTNRALVEARRLYLADGYREIEAFNDSPYADHWFEKAL